MPDLSTQAKPSTLALAVLERTRRTATMTGLSKSNSAYQNQIG